MLEKISTLKHDMKNHLLYLFSMHKDKDYTGAGKYLERYLKDIESEEIVLIKNTFLGAFINSKISQAKKKHIPVRAEINVNKEILIENFDMSVVLGNILDNAVEANLSVEPEKRFMENRMNTVEE